MDRKIKRNMRKTMLRDKWIWKDRLLDTFTLRTKEKERWSDRDSRRGMEKLLKVR